MIYEPSKRKNDLYEKVQDESRPAFFQLSGDSFDG
jgi:hypothetical protein